MRMAVSLGLFCVILIQGGASAEEWKHYQYPSSGFTAEFTGTVREIDLKPDAKTAGYILTTRIFEQAAKGSSFSITAREYRIGTPNIQNLGKILVDRLHCSANVKTAPIAGGGMALSGDNCLANGASFVARLLSRGRWFYQALAVVPPAAAKDGGQFVAALQLTDISRPAPPRHTKAIARARPMRRIVRKRTVRMTPRVAAPAASASPFTQQNWQSPYPANSGGAATPDWSGSFARAR
jgi:hypothetical protein